MFVRSCLSNELIDNFDNYFVVMKNKYSTRNNTNLLRLSIIKTKYARKAVYFAAAKLFNDLPVEAHSMDSKNEFKSFLKAHFQGI